MSIRPVGPLLARKVSNVAPPKSDMPPPSAPVQRQPTPPAQPAPMLVEEIGVMHAALQQAVVKSGQMFRFQADATRAKVSQHAAQGPRGAAAELHRSVERYQQAYDSLESHLLRALAVLEHDLEREKTRLESKREAERALVASPPQMDETQLALSPATITAQASVSGIAARRPSTVSLSSLHHRAPPLKLDLSSVLPMSPVTLAPRTATAAADYTADFLLPPMSGQVIDLTLSETAPVHLGPSTGTSDHPIDVDDVDMDTDLFGGADDSQLNTISTGSGSQLEGHSVAVDDAGDLFTPTENELFNSLAAAGADSAEVSSSASAFLESLDVPGANVDVADATNNILAELQMLPQAGTDATLSGESMTLDGSLSTDSLAGMDMSGIDTNLDSSFFSSDAMPQEMMDLMGMDFTQLSSSLTTEHTDQNDNAS
ncbi:hypothetical protein EXIGLDRAFT_766042 [Exidia glandulosa HHB12029]|uniref:Uncharacterized protein n=1 Tax=Exidia glandulosa HHB12029 TaxID=1314781 RepID=A0A166AVL8_EXIGL|nr:hypothetical protein EXIGLDRAFT_766042 [Exidia glandulosa HHB12029]